MFNMEQIRLSTTGVANQSNAKSRISCCVSAKSHTIHARDNDHITFTIPSGVARNFKRGGGGIIFTIFQAHFVFGMTNLKIMEKQEKL